MCDCVLEKQERLHHIKDRIQSYIPTNEVCQALNAKPDSYTSMNRSHAVKHQRESAMRTRVADTYFESGYRCW